MDTLYIVVPAYNEEENIRQLIADWYPIVEKYNGILIPAHCFTPHKSFYGNCTNRLERIFKEKRSFKDI